MDGMRVKDWFVKKIEIPYGFHLINDIECIEKETEKAYYVRMTIETNDGEHERTLRTWVPKSCTQTAEEYEAEAKENEDRFEAGKERYARLVEWAKAQGVKGVRIGMRKVTILGKIEALGLTVPAEVA